MAVAHSSDSHEWIVHMTNFKPVDDAPKETFHLVQNRSLVRIMWQLAHTTSHFSISLKILSHE